jgi:hypothetical protein
MIEPAPIGCPDSLWGATRPTGPWPGSNPDGESGSTRTPSTDTFEPMGAFVLLWTLAACFGPTGPAHYQEACETDAPDCGDLQCLEVPDGDTDRASYACTVRCDTGADCPMVCGQRPDCWEGTCADVSCTD